MLASINIGGTWITKPSFHLTKPVEFANRVIGKGR